MTQPSASSPVSSFRPASGWQFGQPQARPVQARLVLHPAATALLVVASYLVMLQGIVSVVAASDATPESVVRTGFSWLAGGAVLAVLLSLPSRSMLLLVTTGAIALLDALAYVVMGILGVSGIADPPVVAVALLLGAGAAALGVRSLVTSNESLLRVATAIAALAVVVFYAISIASPILALGFTEQSPAALIRTVPVAVLAVVAGVLLHRTSGPGAVGAAIALAAFGIALGAAAVVSAVLGTPPTLPAAIVVVLRVALVLGAAVVVVLQARRR